MVFANVCDNEDGENDGAQLRKSDTTPARGIAEDTVLEAWRLLRGLHV